VLTLERALIAAQTSATEAEAVAPRNIPVGKAKETATAILSVKEISAVEQTTARKGQLLQMARIAAQQSAMEATAAARKNIHAAKKKETATVTRTARATLSAAVTTALKGQLLRTMTTAVYHWEALVVSAQLSAMMKIWTQRGKSTMGVQTPPCQGGHVRLGPPTLPTLIRSTSFGRSPTTVAIQMGSPDLGVIQQIQVKGGSVVQILLAPKETSSEEQEGYYGFSYARGKLIDSKYVTRRKIIGTMSSGPNLKIALKLKKTIVGFKS